MSIGHWNTRNGSIPGRWLNCPRKAIQPVQNKFLAFKTPLSDHYNDQVPEKCRWNVDMLFSSMKSQNLKIGLWIDLTNTSRFYEKSFIEAHGCSYVKIPCEGHGEVPSDEKSKTFIRTCKEFISHNPLDIIGVHCTYGFNRTGFLIISYLVEVLGCNVDEGLAQFRTARPSGIYKNDYIHELYKRYDDPEDAPPSPVLPAWCLEYDDSNINNADKMSKKRNYSENDLKLSGEPPMKKRTKEFIHKTPVFMAGIPGVHPIIDKHKIIEIQKRVQEICGWQNSGFPGSQPVSMDQSNILLLHEIPYKVSWKADGTRYMLFIQGNGDLYFVDRNNSIFKVNGLSFPHLRDISRNLRDTLLDGEMVIDRVADKDYPRYLAFDIIMYDSKDVSKLPFYPERYSIIEKEVMGGRYNALKQGRILREHEPFSVRQKHFWDPTLACNLLSEKFAKQLGHEPHGLIFQPSKEPYSPGDTPKVLKWKPPSCNSVDFRLEIFHEKGLGIVEKTIGNLFVGGLKEPFHQIKCTKAIKNLGGKIIECTYQNNQWVFMRERTDKSFPNTYATACAVIESILEPVTSKNLLEFIDQ